MNNKLVVQSQYFVPEETGAYSFKIDSPGMVGLWLGDAATTLEELATNMVATASQTSEVEPLIRPLIQPLLPSATVPSWKQEKSTH